MRVYLAAPYGARDDVRTYAAALTRAGFTVTSSWLDETHDIAPGTVGAATALADDAVDAHAVADLADIADSDALVLFTANYVAKEGGGGRHVETGVAIARGLPVVVIGAPENVFHRLRTGVTAVPNFPRAVEHLTLLRSQARLRTACEYCNRDGVTLYAWHADAWCRSCLLVAASRPGALELIGTLDDAPLGRPADPEYARPFVLQTPDGSVLNGVIQ